MITIQKNENTNILQVDGVDQSAYPSHGGYYQYLIPSANPKTALVLGVGAGTVCRMLLEKFPDVKITGIDNNAEVIQVARDHLKLNEVNMDLIMGDAFEFVGKTTERYGLIIVDLFNGYWFPMKVLSPPFVQKCKSLLLEGGSLYINTPNLDLPGSLQFANKRGNSGNIVYYE